MVQMLVAKIMAAVVVVEQENKGGRRKRENRSQSQAKQDYGECYNG